MRCGFSLDKRLLLLMMACLFVVATLTACNDERLKFDTEYQAVLLDNSQAYFGKAEIGSDYITLRSVFYIQSQVNQETKEVKNILIRRGKELHGPELMYINKKHVVFIEPISPNSQVAKLIQEQMVQNPAGTK